MKAAPNAPTERAPVVFATPTRCVRRMAPGEVKRGMTARNAELIFYTVACPACGGIFTYWHKKHRFTEGEWTVTPTAMARDDGDDDRPPTMVNVYHPTRLGAEVPLECPRCGRSIHLQDGEIWAA